MLAFEVVSVCLILVLMGVICWRLAAGTAPGGQGWSGDVFVLPPGVGVSALTLAATSGFLAFAGFESAGSLGEESLVPTRMIPRAIITAVAFGAVFYVACITVQTLGFGTGAAGVSAFRHSQAPLGELARRYVGTPLAALLDLGAVLSALGAGLGGVTVAARMMFAFGRDGLASRRLSGVSAATGVPRRALAAEMLIGLALLTAFRLAGTSALNVFFYLATIGTLSLLVMYVLTNVAAARHLGRRSPVQLVAPAAGVLIAGFVLYHNVWPVPPAPYRFLPYLVLGWLLAGLALTVVIPGFAAKAAGGLERAAGWTLDEPALTGADHRLSPGLGAELAVDGAQMGLERVGRDEQLRGQLAQGRRRGQQPQDRELPVGQRLDQSLLPGARRHGALFSGQPRGDQRPRVGAVPQDAACLTHQRLRIDAGVLRDPGRSGWPSPR